MRLSPGSYPSLTVGTTAMRVVTHVGAVLLVATDRKIWFWIGKCPWR